MKFVNQAFYLLKFVFEHLVSLTLRHHPRVGTMLFVCPVNDPLVKNLAALMPLYMDPSTFLVDFRGHTVLASENAGFASLPLFDGLQSLYKYR